MNILEETTPLFWALTILGSATIFTIFWGLDAKTHKELAKVNITDKELQTHRNILTASLLMEVSLVLMFWFPLAMLPFYIAFAITRLVQESIDEHHFHTDRCDVYESRLHLGMWLSVLTKSIAMFIWGFFTQYEGLTELPVFMFVWGGILVLIMSYISFVEWRR
jgi:hypothetical protein